MHPNVFAATDAAPSEAGRPKLRTILKFAWSRVIALIGLPALVAAPLYATWPWEPVLAMAWGGFVVLTENYIRHEIYQMKTMKRFDPLLREEFGERYEKLLDIYNDER